MIVCFEFLVLEWIWCFGLLDLVFLYLFYVNGVVNLEMKDCFYWVSIRDLCCKW